MRGQPPRRHARGERRPTSRRLPWTARLAVGAFIAVAALAISLAVFSGPAERSSGQGHGVFTAPQRWSLDSLARTG